MEAVGLRHAGCDERAVDAFEDGGLEGGVLARRTVRVTRGIDAPFRRCRTSRGLEADRHRVVAGIHQRLRQQEAVDVGVHAHVLVPRSTWTSAAGSSAWMASVTALTQCPQLMPSTRNSFMVISWKGEMDSVARHAQARHGQRARPQVARGFEPTPLRAGFFQSAQIVTGGPSTLALSRASISRCPPVRPRPARPSRLVVPRRRHELRLLRARVERALRAVPGVAEASVNLATEAASVHARRAARRSSGLRGRRAQGRLRRARAADGPRRRRRAAAHGLGGRCCRGRCCRCRCCCRCSRPVRPATGAGRLAAVGCWPRRCSSGSARASTAAPGRRCAAGGGNMDLLVALGTSAAYGLSVFDWLGWRACRGHGMRAPVFRGLGGGHHAGAAGQVAGGARQAPDHRRPSARCRRCGPTRRACGATASTSTSPVAQVRAGDRARGAARRARRRPTAWCVEGAEPCRRVADHRREPAGGEAAGRRA